MSKFNTILIRNSEVQSYKDCRLKWYWAYGQQRKPLEVSPVLACGTLWHQMLEFWYVPGFTRGAKHLRDLVKPAFQQCVADGEFPDADIMHKPVSGSGNEEIDIVDLCAAMADTYEREYGRDEHIEVLVPEISFQVQVLDKNGKPTAMAVGQIDLTYRDLDLGQVGFMEHKTGGDLNPFGAPENLDEQNAMYWTYGPTFLEQQGLIEYADEVTFLQYNRILKSLDNDDRPEDNQGRKLNKDGTVSKRQPADKVRRSPVYRTVEQREILHRRFLAVAKEMDLVRRKKLPVYKAPGRQCNWCDFEAACDVHEMGGDHEQVIALTTRKWDPYDAHRDKEVVEHG